MVATATTRTALRHMSLAAAIAYVIVTVLTLLMRAVTWAFALIAEVSERIADAGEHARAAARGEQPGVRVWMSTTEGGQR
ncbi:Flp pilus assembly pilin Flp [Kibdelosporangium banguiense]|uniref:Flp pilus assembly pilin Flp n=1 Tax=Kibdelosporangium banguiense TaxID=1365924 RepID=A0ABS4TDA7_9PSEU|nr:hypothetical protein [Kibdelosporangium banguiense]MBP2322402.1 Flp pilus assembly pilin Flp [Kibdelosporangium banguiense]